MFESYKGFFSRFIEIFGMNGIFLIYRSSTVYNSFDSQSLLHTRGNFVIRDTHTRISRFPPTDKIILLRFNNFRFITYLLYIFVHLIIFQSIRFCLVVFTRFIKLEDKFNVVTMCRVHHKFKLGIFYFVYYFYSIQYYKKIKPHIKGSFFLREQ